MKTMASSHAMAADGERFAEISTVATSPMTTCAASSTTATISTCSIG